MSADTFDEHGSRKHRDPAAGNSHRSIDEFFAEAQRRISNDPIKRPFSVLVFQEIGSPAKPIVEHVERRDLAKITSECDRHVPTAAGRLKAAHESEGVLGDDDVLYESPRRPRRRGKVIETVF